MRLNVAIEIEGIPRLVGFINYKNPTEASFQYSKEYIEQGFPAISVSLPVKSEEFSSEITRNFFDGLLPEGFTRRSIAGFIRADADDYLSILRVLGQECIGAIRVFEDGEKNPESAYEKLDSNRIAALAAEGTEASAKIVAGTRLSLAGASGKVGLAYDGKDWYLPRGLAPSTHIVKQSHVRLHDIVVNECLIMRTAEKLGLNTSKCFIINVGDGADGEVLLASERYDRYYDKLAPGGADGEVLLASERYDRYYDKLNHIGRLHQEDFAQILGMNSVNKYETPGEHYLKDMFGVIRKYSADPITDSIELWQRIVFDYFVGNADCHVKNFSMLYDRKLKTLRLAPMYDALSTIIYESTTRDFAFNIGGKTNIDEIGRKNFEKSAAEVGFGVKAAMKLFDQMEEKIENTLKETSECLMREGYAQASEIAKRILLEFEKRKDRQ